MGSGVGALRSGGTKRGGKHEDDSNPPFDENEDDLDDFVDDPSGEHMDNESQDPRSSSKKSRGSTPSSQRSRASGHISASHDRDFSDQRRDQRWRKSRREDSKKSKAVELKPLPNVVEALAQRQIWHRNDRFAILSASWMEGGAKLDYADVAAEKEMEEQEKAAQNSWRHHEDEDEDDAEEDEIAHAFETESETELRLEREQAEAEEQAQKERECIRREKLKRDPNFGGFKLWIQARDWRNEFCTRDRLKEIKRERERRFGKPAQPLPKIHGENWFRVPVVRGAEEADGSPEAWCWRNDFIFEVLALAKAHGMELPLLDLEKARQAFRKDLNFAFKVHTHLEVVSLDGIRQLWSPAFAQTVATVRARCYHGKGADAAEKDPKDPRRSVSRVCSETGLKFPPPLGRHRLSRTPLPKPRPAVLVHAKECQRLFEDRKRSLGMSPRAPSPPEVPFLLPYREYFKTNNEPWTLIPPSSVAMDPAFARALGLEQTSPCGSDTDSMSKKLLSRSNSDLSGRLSGASSGIAGSVGSRNSLGGSKKLRASATLLMGAGGITKSDPATSTPKAVRWA
eukprot:TRINITY_DN31173_c0_g1_i1.p1 TRINITY_DN31173_c0_g1~~TRINITY_DN31173_c0_g1_i1.p1  ORF type:complete len:568 (-),score=115.37 TRINITY_DN31173_c0_g1_i1:89-1792(-)